MLIEKICVCRFSYYSCSNYSTMVINLFLSANKESLALMSGRQFGCDMESQVKNLGTM